MTTLSYDCDALRSDGGVVHIRSVRPDDREALLDLDARVSVRSIYRRFFTLSRFAADAYVETLMRPANQEHEALIAEVNGLVVAVASYERVTSESAEIAVLVDDPFQQEGIGSLLIEHLAEIARQRGINRFVADVLNENAEMIRLLRSLRYAMTSTLELDEVRMEFALNRTADVIEAEDDRERAADLASLQALLSPASVAVIGAGEKPSSVGREVLQNLLTSGFTGSVHVVNPNHRSVLGIPCVASARLLPVPVDLAIVAVPVGRVLEVICDCGERGVRSAVVLTAGFGETGVSGAALQSQLLEVARRYGIRLVGPNCLGIANTDSAVRLNATFAPLPMTPGTFGLVSQSGALGAAVLVEADRRGLGFSQFVSVGNKVDVSSNDLLLAWERDERVGVIGLYLESFGRPRKFAHIAQRVSRVKPIIAIKSGRTPAGQRAGQSHTAAAVSADGVVDALFVQAGVLRVDQMEQMLDAAQLLAGQPLPTGPRVAIVGNSGGPEILAADAAEVAGLTLVDLTEATTAELRAAVPGAASLRNPIDLGAGAAADHVAAAVRVLLAAPEVDAVLAVFTETLIVDSQAIAKAVSAAAVDAGKPLQIVEVGSAARSIELPGFDRTIPVYAFPEPAAVALGHAVRYARMRSRAAVEPDRSVERDEAAARQFVVDQSALGSHWLGPEETAQLLGYYGIATCEQVVVDDVESALRAAVGIGYPVAAKLSGPVVHKSDIGGVRLGLTDEVQLRDAVGALLAIGRGGRSRVLIQPMVGRGVEIIVGAMQDARFGPVVMVGAGGVLSDLLADRALRLAPLSTPDAREMTDGLRCAVLFDGYRGQEPVSRSALSTLLLKVSALIEDLAEVAELDLNPVICCGDSLIVVDAKVRVAPTALRPETVVRRLRG